MKKFGREVIIRFNKFFIFRDLGLDKVIDFAILKIVNPTALLHFDERRRSFIFVAKRVKSKQVLLFAFPSKQENVSPRGSFYETNFCFY